MSMNPGWDANRNCWGWLESKKPDMRRPANKPHQGLEKNASQRIRATRIAARAAQHVLQKNEGMEMDCETLAGGTNAVG